MGEREYLATSDDGNARVYIVPDDMAENPRRDGDCYIAHAVTVPNTNYHDPDPDQGPLASAWRRLYDHYGWSHRRGAIRAVDIFDRYVSLCYGGATREESPHNGPTTVWYVLGEELDRAGLPRDQAADVLAGEQREYRAWADGETYGFVIEERTGCEGHTSVAGEHMGLTIECDGSCRRGRSDEWEQTDMSCWGLIGYDYAVQFALEQWAAFLADRDK